MGTITVTNKLRSLYQEQAERLRAQGASLHVDRDAMLVVFVKDRTAMMFEGSIALNLLNRCPSNVAAEDYLLAIFASGSTEPDRRGGS